MHLGLACPGPSNPGTCCSKFQFSGEEAGAEMPCPRTAVGTVMSQKGLLGSVSFLHRIRAAADAMTAGSQGKAWKQQHLQAMMSPA